MSHIVVQPDESSQLSPTTNPQPQSIVSDPKHKAGETSYITPRPSASVSPSPPYHPQIQTRATHQERDWYGRGRTPWRVSRTPEKRKRPATTLMEGDETAPKRIRTGAEVATPDTRKLDNSFARLTWSTRAPSPSQSRKASPTRNLLNDLRTVTPKVSVNAHYEAHLPPAVYDNVEDLRNGLSEDEGIIPAGLKSHLENTNAPETKGIKRCAYDTKTIFDARTLESIWDEVKTVYLNAKECSRWSKDENAWSDDVTRLVLAWGDADGFFEVLNIKTQSLYSDHLPRHTNGDTIAQKKTDYAIAFSAQFPEVQACYKAISFAGECICLSQMTDVYTRMLAMLSAAEIKIEGGNAMEAKFQLALWFTAGLRSIRELAEAATKDISIMDDVPMFGWTVVGHTWDLYVAFVEDGQSGAVRIAGPIESLTVNTRTYAGVFKLHALVRRIKSYGRNTYWQRLKKRILEPLVQARTSGGPVEDNVDDR